MKLRIDDHRIPILSWCEALPGNALEQAINLTRLPVTFHHVALMADCHSGYGMPIGGVVACRDAVIPNAVGVDIGCGMCAVRTDLPLTEVTPAGIASILRSIKAVVPVGFEHHRSAQPWAGFDRAPDLPVVRAELESARRQLGTLGGGNHFIELQAGDEGLVWLMVHSGSRNFGLKIAGHYHRAALEWCRKHAISLPDTDLAYLPLDTKAALEYLEGMAYAMSFAAENRRRIRERCQECIAAFRPCAFDEEIAVHHNFAAREVHFGREVIVHRKGATRAQAGIAGIVPGSMGTASFIVRGRGNPESFFSSSHGAGRSMGRNEANRLLSENDVRASMKGVVFGGFGRDRRGRPDLSEAPQAYKNIEDVMEAQQDLVEIVTRLRPLGVVKG